jgi:hypothetical protein
VLLPEFPAERVDEEQYDLFWLGIGAAEAIRREERPKLFAGEQIMQRVGDIAEAVIGIDRLQQRGAD